MRNNSDINFGLTLSGGGARGLAHIGLLKALENANFQPDYLTVMSLGGVSTAVAALARSLRQRGHQVMVCAAADPPHKDIDLDIVGLRAFHYEHFPGGRAPLAPLRLTQKLANFDPDVIHNH